MSYLELEALSVNQPLETFYVAKIKAKDLLKICYTDPIRYDDGVLIGGQRLLDESRAKEIGNFISGTEAAFPNSVILAANFDDKGFNLEVDDAKRWSIKNANGTSKLIIPTEEKLASIIDGQHRIYGFKYVSPQFLEIEIVCSIYLDLPNPYQAYLFATINSNQKKVDKSLAYEQFGFNIEKEEPISWSPDKLAISITRKLNSEQNALQNHIKISPQIDDVLKAKFKDQKWLISTSTIVDGILRLITSDPKRDKYELQKLILKERDRQKLTFPDKAPLRELYLGLQDLVIYKILVNYFNAIENKLFNVATKNSSIYKTVGIQALFEVLRTYIVSTMVNQNLKEINFKQEFFENLLEPVSNIDFSNEIFQYSGVGKGRILNVILIKLRLKDIDAIKDDKEQKLLKDFIANKPLSQTAVININVNEKYEMEYWSKKLGVTLSQLEKVINQVGANLYNIEEHIKSGRK